MEKKDKFTFKITVIGDGTVGKTSLIKKFSEGSFEDDYIQTIGAEFSKHVEEIDGDKCTLFFWDIAGQDTFHFLRPSFYDGSNAVIVVYSLENNEVGKESFSHVKNWHNMIKKHCGDIPVVLFGNKVDLVEENTLDDEEALEIVKKRNFIGYFRTSAKTGEKVTQAFHTIIKKLHREYRFRSFQISK